MIIIFSWRISTIIYIVCVGKGSNYVHLPQVVGNMFYSSVHSLYDKLRTSTRTYKIVVDSCLRIDTIKSIMHGFIYNLVHCIKNPMAMPTSTCS